MQCILLTGATGVVGSALVPICLEGQGTEVKLLLRADSPSHLQERLGALYGFWRWAGSDPRIERIEAVRGDVRLARWGLDPPEYVKTFRHALTHLKPGGCYETVDRMDGDLSFDIGRNLAALLQIPLMIAGLSPGQVERVLGLHSFESPRHQERTQRTHSAGFCLEGLYDAQQRKQYWWDGTSWPQDRIARVLYPFYAWSYDEDFIRGEVVRLGLIEPGQDNPLATNNDTIPVMLAVDTCRLGYSGFEPEFAELVRAGKADRAWWLSVFQAIEYLSQQGDFLSRSIAETLERLELTHAMVGLPQPERG